MRWQVPRKPIQLRICRGRLFSQTADSLVELIIAPETVAVIGLPVASPTEYLIEVSVHSRARIPEL